jgi:hypothetical protein
MRTMNEKERVALLERVNERGRTLETAVAAVVQGYQSALFIHGPPGLGKTHLLTTMLDGLAGKGWRHHTAYSTPKALMLSIAEEPAAIHLFEDCEAMLKMGLSASILRAACGAPGDRQRWVTYETAHEKLRVNFTGGIVIATNGNLAKGSGPLQGVASRFRPILWTMTLDERIACILNIAEAGWVKGIMRVNAKDAIKVAHALIGMVHDSRLDVELDLRLFTEHALPAFAYSTAKGQGDGWQDMLLAKLTGTAETVTEAREEKTRRLRQLALQLSVGEGTSKQRANRWKEMTGLGQAIYYRHLRDARADEKKIVKSS